MYPLLLTAQSYIAVGLCRE